MVVKIKKVAAEQLSNQCPSADNLSEWLNEIARGRSGFLKASAKSTTARGALGVQT